jgi:hypothetical protein
VNDLSARIEKVQETLATQQQSTAASASEQAVLLSALSQNELLESTQLLTPASPFESNRADENELNENLETDVEDVVGEWSAEAICDNTIENIFSIIDEVSEMGSNDVRAVSTVVAQEVGRVLVQTKVIISQSFFAKYSSFFFEREPILGFNLLR